MKSEGLCHGYHGDSDGGCLQGSRNQEVGVKTKKTKTKTKKQGKGAAQPHFDADRNFKRV